MDAFSVENPNSVAPSDEEREEAKKNPGGWLYRIAGNFSPTEDIPPKAIVGAWSVDSKGDIFGAFLENPSYDAILFPAGIRK